MPKAFCDELMPDRVYLYPTEYNTYGNGGLAVTTRPDATIASGVKEYRVADALGSTRVVITATTVAETDYLPFGQAVTGLTVGPSARTTYIGREVDGESAIGDFGFRRYDDGDGRFLSADPLWSMAPGVSPYVYCENDPVNLVDPFGLDGERKPTGREDRPDDAIPMDDQEIIVRPHENLAYRNRLVNRSPWMNAPSGFGRWSGGVDLSGYSEGSDREPATISTPRLTREAALSGLLRNAPFVGPFYHVIDAGWVLVTRHATSQARHIDGRFANDRQVTEAGVTLLQESLLMAYGTALSALRSAERVTAAVAEAEAYLGGGAKVIKNSSGDMIFQSADELREIRFDFNNFSPHHAPHVHVIRYVREGGRKVPLLDKRMYPR